MRIKLILLISILLLTIFPCYSTIYIRKGNNRNGVIVYNYNETTKILREGQTSLGKIIYTKDKNRIRIGASSYGKVQAR